jgi:hypothetical protein
MGKMKDLHMQAIEEGKGKEFEELYSQSDIKEEVDMKRKEEVMDNEITRLAKKLVLPAYKEFLRKRNLSRKESAITISYGFDVDSVAAANQDPESLMIAAEEQQEESTQESHVEVKEVSPPIVITEEVKKVKQAERALKRRKFEFLVLLQKKVIKNDLEEFRRRLGTSFSRKARPIQFFGPVVMLTQHGQVELTEVEAPGGKKIRIMTAVKFNQRLKSRTIFPKEESCRITGYVNTDEMELDDFHSGDVTVDVGSGFFEVISREDFLDTKLRSLGIKEYLAYLSRNEIRYGKSQEFSENTVEPDFDEILIAMGDTEPTELEIVDYEFRSKEEMLYHASQVKNLLNRDYRSWKDLYDAVKGTIFPMTYTSKGEITRDNVWTVPLNALSKQSRAELRRLYRTKMRKFKAIQRKARLTIEYLSLLDMKDSDLEKKISKLLTRTGEDKEKMALAILSVAKRLSNERKAYVLNKRTFAILNSYISGGNVSAVERGGKVEENLNKLLLIYQDPNSNLVAEVNKLEPIEAKEVLKLAGAIKRETKKDAIPKQLWTLLNNRSKQEQGLSDDLKEYIREKLKKLDDISSVTKEEAQEYLEFARKLQKEKQVKIFQYQDYQFLLSKSKGE